MFEFNYYQLYKKSKDIISERLKIVESAKNIGIKPTARKYKMSKHTVKKWLKRYEMIGKDGLKDQKRR